MIEYGPVGRCIYCNKTAAEAGLRELGREHIIPLSLKGELILLQASCVECANQTGADEGFCAKNTFRIARTHFGWKSRKSKKPNALLLGKNPKGEQFDWQPVPLQEHPPFAILPIFSPPGRIVGLAMEPNQISVTGAIAHLGPDLDQKMARHGKRVAAGVVIDPGPFCRMLAKIAHAYTVAKLGLSGFNPLLRDIILNKAQNFADFVGSPLVQRDSGSAELHAVELSQDKELIGVYIRLYATGQFQYFVVSGTPL